MLLAWVLLPWIHQPERGPTLARIISAERSANELDIQRQGLSLPPIAALVTMGLALWGMFSPQHSRALALVTLIAGLLGLVYHLTFFLAVGERSAELLPQMGSGFWLTLMAGLLLLAQFALPRKVSPGYEISKVLGNQESVLALGILTLIIVVGVLNPRYVADRNISEILQGNSYIAVAAIGVSMVIMSGNIDISIGSLIGVLGIISGAMVVAGYPVWLSWLDATGTWRFGRLADWLPGCLAAHPLHHRDPWHAQHPQGRPFNLHQCRMDHRYAGLNTRFRSSGRWASRWVFSSCWC